MVWWIDLRKNVAWWVNQVYQITVQVYHFVDWKVLLAWRVRENEVMPNNWGIITFCLRCCYHLIYCSLGLGGIAFAHLSVMMVEVKIEVVETKTNVFDIRENAIYEADEKSQRGLKSNWKLFLSNNLTVTSSFVWCGATFNPIQISISFWRLKIYIWIIGSAYLYRVRQVLSTKAEYWIFINIYCCLRSLRQFLS